MPTLEERIAAVRSEFSDFPVLGGFLRRELMLPADDGAKLKTVIFTPDGVPAPWPTVVQRCCYPQNIPTLEAEAEEYAKRGFAFAYQMCRGTGGSEGEWEPNVHERADGLSFVRFLQEADWVASMGYCGASYLALTGWAMADAVPDKTKTMYLTVYGTVRHASAWKDGLFRQDILTAWAMSNAGHPVDADYLESARFRPQIRVDEEKWGGALPWYRDWISHPDPKDPYWAEGFWGQLHDIPGKLRIPIFVAEGWYDHHLGSMLEGWQTVSETALKHSVLQIYPGNHGFMPAIYGHPDAKNARAPQLTQAFQWFDAILRKGKLPEPKVVCYEIGADRWVEYPAYPLPKTGERALYLSDRALTDAPEAEGTREYVYDPEDPLMSHGGETLFASWPHIGSQEQPGPDYRPDVLSFVSAPFENGQKICGSVKVRLYVQTDAPDTCFAVKLMEVFADGRAFHIRGAVTTIRWNKNTYHDYDGSVIPLELEATAITWRVQPGSRLRLDVSSSNFPEYSVHPNTDVLWSLAETTQKARQTVFFGPDHPSCVILPE